MQANPVIVKELRGRMRGWRAAVIMTVYLLVLSGISLLFYAAIRPSAAVLGTQSSMVGKGFFSALVIFQMIMVALITPAFTAGAITTEKEQKTYDLLMTTLLPARSVIFGKLGSALAYVLLLILSIAPLESLAFMFGGVSPEEIILSQLVVLAAAILFASVGIFWSSILKSSVGSNVLTYGTILFQLIGIPVIYYTILTSLTVYNYSNSAGPPQPTVFEYYISSIITNSHPIIAMVTSETALLEGDSLFIYTSTTALQGKTVLVISPWLMFCMEALIISALLVLFSIRLVRPIRYKSRQSAPQAQYATVVQQVPQPEPVSVVEEVDRNG